MSLVTRKDLQENLAMILTADYVGSQNKKEALIAILAPLGEALIQCESEIWAGTTNSNLVAYLLKEYAAAGLEDIWARPHEEVEDDIKEHFDSN